MTINDISNKTLIFLLLAAIAISLGGTFVTIHRLNLLATSTITGLAAGNGTGTTTLDVVGFNSVTMSVSALDMGSCTAPVQNSAVVNTTENTGNCTATEEPLNLTVQNDGNQNLNITVQSTVAAANFLGGGTGGNFWFKTLNSSSRGGCRNNTKSNNSFYGLTWTAFTAADTDYSGCDNLTFIDTQDELVAEFQWSIPSDTPALGDRLATITFVARTPT